MKNCIILTAFIFLMVSCETTRHKGIVMINDLNKEGNLLNEDKKPSLNLEDISDKSILEEHPNIRKRISNMKDELIKNAKLKRILKSKNKEKDKQNKLKFFTNVKDLGVIDITSKIPLLAKRKSVSKKKYFVVRDNPNEDKFGGKLVCNEEVLILRLDRSHLIKCMEHQKSILPFDWKTILVNHRFKNVIDYRKKDIYEKCLLDYSVALSAYHNLSSCLIKDKKEHGVFKYRNINSFGFDFKIIQGHK